MAKPEDCRVCARLTKKAGEPTKCKRHGGAGVKKTGGGKKKATRRAAKRARLVRDPAPPNGHSVDLKDNEAKAAGQTFLTGLYRLRDKLSAHIKGVEDLVGAL